MSLRKKIVWLPYDFDTAIGINNEGALVFSYNLEDTDHLEGGADVFNGQDSVVWNNIRDAFGAEIKAMYQELRSQGKLSYNLVENAFDTHQNKWCEAIFNEDAYFKYLAPLIAPDVGVQPTAVYLSMLQGSKREQRKWWLYNRFRYMDSKYNAGDALTDVIQIRGYAKDNITITPYADIYASIKYGSYLVQTRANRNVPYTLTCPVDTLNDTEIYIYSASQLSSIGDISGLKPGFADFSNGKKLINLKVGDSSPSYNNSNLKTLYVGTNDLLQTIDVRNCTALGTDEQTTVDLSGAKNIENIYFEGTAIKGCVLPNGGIIKTLHLPATITNLTIQNQKAITDFVMPTYSNISTLRLENVGAAFPVMSILNGLTPGTRVRLTGFNWNCADVAEINSILDILDTMKGVDGNGNNLDHAYESVAGVIHAPTLTGNDIASFRARGYQYITFTADTLTVTLTYRTYNGASVLATETIRNGGNGTRNNTWSRSSTEKYNFSPNGWAIEPDGETDDDALLAVTENRTVYAAYVRTIRTYTVTWKNTDGTILEVDVNVPYETIPTYDGPTPTYNGDNASGWTTEVVPVTGDTTYIASYVPVYTVYFYDGTTLLQTVTVRRGEDAHYTGELPTSPDGDFLTWNPEPTNVVENLYCYPVFNFGMDEPDLKYLIYTINDQDMTITISGLNVANIIGDNLSVLTIPDTIDGHRVIIT